jgi:hypothetical protein
MLLRHGRGVLPGAFGFLYTKLAMFLMEVDYTSGSKSV